MGSQQLSSPVIVESRLCSTVLFYCPGLASCSTVLFPGPVNYSVLVFCSTVLFYCPVLLFCCIVLFYCSVPLFCSNVLL